MLKQNSQNIWFGWFSGLSAIAVIISLILLRHQSPQVQAEDITDSPAETISYETQVLPRSIVHIVRIPATASATLAPTLAANGLETVEGMSQRHKAIAVINGGFFDPNNQQTTSFITQNGNVRLDPTTNSRLIDNPNLEPYLPQILNRSEFRRYQCQSEQGTVNQYAIAPHNQSPPHHCRLVDALGAGPALLPKFQGEAEAFLDPTTGRDAIGSQTPNARSAIGITADGTILLIMAAQRADVTPPSGLSLPELADVMASLGIQQGLNLDGGSSSSLYYNGTSYYGRLEANNTPIQRPVKSAIAVFSTP